MKLLLFIPLFITSVHAFTLSPMVDTINSDEQKKFSIGFIENNGDSSIAIQLTSKKREIDGHGVETLGEDDGDIMIFPEQLIIPPHNKRNFKLTYLGKPSAKELSYRIIVEEFPLDQDFVRLKPLGVVVKLVYYTSLYVCHGKALPNIFIESFKKDPIIKDLMLITIANDGEKHQNLNNIKITAKSIDSGNILVLDREQFKALDGLALLAGHKVIAKASYKEISNKIGGNFTLELHFDKN
jgi:P pilus assembly chaperone PapD